NRVPLEFQDQPAVLIRLVPHGDDVGDDLLVDEICDLLFQRGAIHVERNFRDDELFALTLLLLEADFAAQLQAYAACFEIVLNAFDAADHAAGGEVRAFDEGHQVREGDGRVVNLSADTVNDFTEVVRGHVRRHADRDAGAAIDQEIRKGGRQDGRLGQTFIVVGNEIHRFFVHVEQQGGAQVRESSF